jgi:hypothetical protein
VFQSQFTAAVLDDESSSGSRLDVPPMLRDTASSAPAQAPGVSQLLDLVFVTLVVAPTMAAQELHYRLVSCILVLFLESFLVLYFIIFNM